MQPSTLVLSFGALAAAQTMTHTVTDSTTVTIVSCGPEVPHSSCPANNKASSTLAPVVTPTTTPGGYAPGGYESKASSSEIHSVAVPVVNLPPVANTTVVEVPAHPVTTPGSDLKTISVPVYTNASTSIYDNATGIITASGTPTILTSVTLVTASHSGAHSSSSTAPPNPTDASAAVNLVVPSIMLGLLALGACILG